MARLAIKGHPTRGREVVEILEILGGENKYNINFTEYNLLYTIREGDDAIIGTYPNSSISRIFTLEEFLEKFPYKVGDKVINKNYKQIFEILSVRWCAESNTIMYQTSNGWYSVHGLKPYKEETMEEIRIDIPNRYEFFGINDDNQIVLTKKQPQYPKTCEECLIVLSKTMNSLGIMHGYKFGVLMRFQQLLICRDAYWKIAGEQMGLGEPWKPDFTNDDEERYGIYTTANKVVKDFCGVGDVNMILTFPTEEMCDAFFENFKDLIDLCKVFL